MAKSNKDISIDTSLFSSVRLVTFRIPKPVDANIHPHSNKQVRFSSQIPESLTKKIDALFSKFEDNLSSQSLIMRNVAPNNPLLDVVFPMVMLKKSSDTNTYHMTFYMTPKNTEREHAINSEDFKESHFEINVDFNRNINNSVPSKLVGYLVRLTPYDLYAIEHLADDANIPGDELVKLRDIYFKLGLCDMDGRPFESKSTPKAIDILCIGRIQRIRGQNKQNERASIFFYKIFILEDSIRRKFNRSLGLPSNASSINMIRQAIDRNNKVFFGVSPYLIRKDLRKIIKSNSGSFSYKASGFQSNRVSLNTFIPTKELISLGNNININRQLRKHPVTNYKRKVNNVSNPFKCMELCEKDGQCDIYNQVNRTCHMYGFKDSKEDQYKAAMNYLLEPKAPALYDYGPNNGSMAQKQDMEKQNIVVNLFAYAGYANEEHRNEINRRIQKMESHQKLYKDIWEIKSTTEDFTNRDSGVLDNDITAYDQAYQQAIGLNKERDLANMQSKFALKDKIYYNLATIGLWIINIACLIAILYVLFIGFFGSDSGNNGENVLAEMTQQAVPQQQLYGNRPSVYNE